MLNVISINEFESLIENIPEVGGEYIDILDSHGRVLEEDIFSRVNIPGFKRSAVDGYAVNSSSTNFCDSENPKSLLLRERINIGEIPKIFLKDTECSYIPTGGMLPKGADSIIMIEETEVIGEEVFIYKSVNKNENIVKENEDISIGEEILSKGTVLGASEIAVLISIGLTSVKVKKRVKVGIISTGDELLEINEQIVVPKIKETNGKFLNLACIEDGCISKHYGIIKDNKEDIRYTIGKALEENDLVFLSGGSSAGNKDFTKDVIREFGEVLFHGLSVKPGKPTMMAKCKNNKYIVGFPGHPLACIIVYKFVILKLINKLYGKPNEEIIKKLEFGENYYKKTDRDEYLAVKIIENKVYPIYAKSSAMSTIIKCDGVVRIDRDIEGYTKGEIVNVISLMR